MNRVAIRVDGGDEIGMGHVIRSLALANEMAKTNEVFFICKTSKLNTDKFKSGIERIKKNGFVCVLIDEESMLEDLSNIKADCLITDSYDVDDKYFIESKKMFRKTGYIDDLNHHYLDVDFVINQNIVANDYEYKCDERTRLFLGTKYAMLREEFLKSKPIALKKKVNSVLITMGGADPVNFTEKIIPWIEGVNLNFHIVIGGAFNRINELRDKCIGNRNITLHFNPNMVQVMSMCDIAVSACGSTLYELAIMGIPTVGIVLAENQLAVAKKMGREGSIVSLGWFESVDKSKFLDSLNEIKEFSKREAMTFISRSMFKRDGISVLVEKINEILNNWS